MGLDLAILSCGPALQAFLDDPQEHDGYIVVNRAAAAYPTRWAPERLKLQALVVWAENRDVSICHGQPR